MTREPWDAMTPGDLSDLDDARQRALTVSAIEGDAPWPLSSILPLQRLLTHPETGEVLKYEAAYVRQGAALVVLMSDGPVTQRRYADAESLVNDGWRVD